jgi:hypothetical protein
MSGKLLSSIVFESEGIEGLLGVIRNEAKLLFQSIVSEHLSEPRLPLSEPEFAELKNVQNKSGVKASAWVSIGLAVAGIGAGVYGFLQENEYKRLHKEYVKTEIPNEAESLRKEAETAAERRNIGYTVGSALLASGITIYFVF